MRTIGFRSTILVAIAAAFGVVAALGRPWYGMAPADAPAGDMERLFSGIGRAFSETGGTSGWIALETADRTIAGLAFVTASLLLLTLYPSVQLQVQALARWTGLATFGLVLFKLLDEPGVNRATEPRYGLLVALGSAAVLLASASTLAGAPPPKRHAPVFPQPGIAPAPTPTRDRDL
jgi:hypothetical protein